MALNRARLADIQYIPSSAGALITNSVSKTWIRSIIIPGPGLVLSDTNDTIQGVTTTVSKVTVMFTGDNET
jgi:hypothetical protein